MFSRTPIGDIARDIRFTGSRSVQQNALARVDSSLVNADGVHPTPKAARQPSRLIEQSRVPGLLLASAQYARHCGRGNPMAAAIAAERTRYPWRVRCTESVKYELGASRRKPVSTSMTSKSGQRSDADSRSSLA